MKNQKNKIFMLKRTLKKNWLSLLAAGSTVLMGTLTTLTTSPAKAVTELESPQSASTSMLLAQSDVIQATSAQEDTLYLNDDRAYSYNLIATERETIDGVTIPVGATIIGQYQPAEGGLRYVASAVAYDNYRYQISATSPVIEAETDPRDTSTGSVAEDAGIGAATGLVLGEVFGDAGVGEVVGGAAAGAAVGNVTADEVVVVEPDQRINLYE
jgi:hypothetical protein